MEISFTKMHGLGNDFVVLDLRADEFELNSDQLRLIADRRYGVGCDQILVIYPAVSEKSDILMKIFNPDGTEAQACGNGTRCVAHKFMSETGTQQCRIETAGGVLECKMLPDDIVEVDMGIPRLEWQQIPLAQECDTLNLGIVDGPLNNPVAVNVGNPHTVFFVDNLDSIKIDELGPQVEKHVMFPERTNVEFVKVLSSSQLRVKVWERGTGITNACGSGACATIVAAVRRGLCNRKAEIILDGGALFMEWRSDDEHILMLGPVAYVYKGENYSLA
jgi:diaminopimelate epimerase